jgi:hypothetical protein
MFEYTYTRQQAISDGIIVPITERMVFTTNLFSEGYEDVDKRTRLIEQGLSLLAIPDSEDSETFKLRIIEQDQIWLIQNIEGLCFLKPDDY